MKLTCVVVDDDLYFTEQIRDYISEIPQLELVKCYTDAGKALQELKQNSIKIDILFSDIEMPELNGIELSSKVREKFNFLVFISAYTKYAFDGYKLKAIDFLSKPVSFAKFRSSVMRIFDESKLGSPFILIKVKDTKYSVKICIDDIIYIEADGNYINIITTNKTYTTLSKMSDIEQKISMNIFFIRIHKSYIISLNHLKKIDRDFVFMVNKKSLPIGPAFSAAVKKVWISKTILGLK